MIVRWVFFQSILQIYSLCVNIGKRKLWQHESFDIYCLIHLYINSHTSNTPVDLDETSRILCTWIIQNTSSLDNYIYIYIYIYFLEENIHDRLIVMETWNCNSLLRENVIRGQFNPLFFSGKLKMKGKRIIKKFTGPMVGTLSEDIFHLCRRFSQSVLSPTDKEKRLLDNLEIFKEVFFHH